MTAVGCQRVIFLVVAVGFVLNIIHIIIVSITTIIPVAAFTTIIIELCVLCLHLQYYLSLSEVVVVVFIIINVAQLHNQHNKTKTKVGGAGVALALAQ